MIFGPPDLAAMVGKVLAVGLPFGVLPWGLLTYGGLAPGRAVGCATGQVVACMVCIAPPVLLLLACTAHYVGFYVEAARTGTPFWPLNGDFYSGYAFVAWSLACLAGAFFGIRLGWVDADPIDRR